MTSKNFSNFLDGLKDAPEWPYYVMFLPAGHSESAPEMGWMKDIQQSFGSRLIALTVVNNTEADSKIMEFFNIKEPEELPCARGIKPNTINITDQTMELYIPSGYNFQWDYPSLLSFGHKVALPVKQKLPAFNQNEMHVVEPDDFRRLCINQKEGRCVIYFVNPKKHDQQLSILKKAVENVETAFYSFHISWADISMAHDFFNFPQVDMSKTPQAVVLDARESVFMPRSVEGDKDLLEIIKIFDQPGAMQRIKDAMMKGTSPLATVNAARAPTHTEL